MQDGLPGVSQAPARSMRADELAATALPTLSDIRLAADRIRRFVPETPLIKSYGLSRLLDADVWLKIETATPIASYKLRGAVNHLLVARGIGKPDLAVTSSTGNHGQGVAWAAMMLGMRASIYLPVNSVEVKKETIRLLGADVVEIGSDVDEAKDHARTFAREAGAVFVDDGESFEMIEGAGTLGLEIADRLSDVHRVYVPMGSGTMATGVATAVRGSSSATDVIAVQSEGAPAMVESFRARRAVERSIDTTADCLVCRVPARRALAGIIERLTDCRLVSDQALLAAMHTIIDTAHLMVEPGAAAGLAAAWADRGQIHGKRVVLVLSGANASPSAIRDALAAPRFPMPQSHPSVDRIHA